MPVTVWTLTTLVALLAPMAGPFLGAATAALALMHLGIAAVLIPGLRRTAYGTRDTASNENYAMSSSRARMPAASSPRSASICCHVP